MFETKLLNAIDKNQELEQILNGDLDETLDAIRAFDQAEKLHSQQD